MTGHTVPALTAITGGSGSIGLATAQALLEADRDAAVVLLDLQPGDAAGELLGAEPERAHFVACDVTSPEAVAAAFARIDEIGPLSGLVYAAGLVDNSDSTELEFERWRAVLAVNLDGAFLTLQGAARDMVAREEGGSLVGTASLAALSGQPRGQHYAASKGGLIAMVNSCAVELARYGIRGNSILPG